MMRSRIASENTLITKNRNSECELAMAPHYHCHWGHCRKSHLIRAHITVAATCCAVGRHQAGFTHVSYNEGCSGGPWGGGGGGGGCYCIAGSSHSDIVMLIMTAIVMTRVMMKNDAYHSSSSPCSSVSLSPFFPALRTCNTIHDRVRCVEVQ